MADLIKLTVSEFLFLKEAIRNSCRDVDEELGDKFTKAPPNEIFQFEIEDFENDKQYIITGSKEDIQNLYKF